MRELAHDPDTSHRWHQTGWIHSPPLLQLAATGARARRIRNPGHRASHMEFALANARLKQGASVLRLLALGLSALTIEAALGPRQASPRVSLAQESKLVRNLPQYVARSRPTWPKHPESEAGSTVMESRKPWSVSFR